MAMERPGEKPCTWVYMESEEKVLEENDKTGTRAPLGQLRKKVAKDQPGKNRKKEEAMLVRTAQGQPERECRRRSYSRGKECACGKSRRRGRRVRGKGLWQL
jgi:hypothetical protein